MNQNSSEPSFHHFPPGGAAAAGDSCGKTFSTAARASHAAPACPGRCTRGAGRLGSGPVSAVIHSCETGGGHKKEHMKLELRHFSVVLAMRIYEDRPRAK